MTSEVKSSNIQLFTLKNKLSVFLAKKNAFINNLNTNKWLSNEDNFSIDILSHKNPRNEFYLLKWIVPKQRGAEMTKTFLLLYLGSFPKCGKMWLGRMSSARPVGPEGHFVWILSSPPSVSDLGKVALRKFTSSQIKSLIIQKQ